LFDKSFDQITPFLDFGYIKTRVPTRSRFVQAFMKIMD
jgi:hypothetical protein